MLIDSVELQSGYIQYYRGSGATYNGSFPNGSYNYGVFFAARRGDNIFVIAFPENPEHPVIQNRYLQSRWLGWHDFQGNDMQI